MTPMHVRSWIGDRHSATLGQAIVEVEPGEDPSLIDMIELVDRTASFGITVSYAGSPTEIDQLPPSPPQMRTNGSLWRVVVHRD